MTEIKKVARKNPVLGAEGAVIFLEKLSPAIEHVDSSSGAIGTAVNNAITALVQIVSDAPADDKMRDNWVARLWDAVQDDGMTYIENLTDYWGDLCVTPQRASKWVDEFLPMVKMQWNGEAGSYGHFKGTSVCLSALLKSERHEELLDLLNQETHKFWHYRKWGVRALAAMGKKSEAIRYAEQSQGLNDSPIEIALECEEILLSSGLAEEAYQRYAISANQKPTYLATFRTIAKKYPDINKHQILGDLIASTPGSEGKWFAAAKSFGLFDEAIELANRSPCDPNTLARAARDMASSNSDFAMEAGIAALKWLLRGHGYEITGTDVVLAYSYTMEAAENAGKRVDAIQRIHDLIKTERHADQFVFDILMPRLNAESGKSK